MAAEVLNEAGPRNRHLPVTDADGREVGIQESRKYPAFGGVYFLRFIYSSNAP